MADDDKTQDEALRITMSLVDYVFTEATGVQIPVPSIAVNTILAHAGWRSTNFARKLKAFMREPEKLDPKTRKEFQQKLGNSELKFMNELFQAVDELENEEKAEMLGKVFTIHMTGKITRETYQLLTNIIRTTLYTDLEIFFNNKHQPPVGNSRTAQQQRLSISGLLNEEQKIDIAAAKYRAERLGGNGNPEVEYKYSTTDLGYVLYNIKYQSIDDIAKCSYENLTTYIRHK